MTDLGLWETCRGQGIYRQGTIPTPVRRRHTTDHKAQEQYEGSFDDDVGQVADKEESHYRNH